jgi:hypothetical protein
LISFWETVQTFERIQEEKRPGRCTLSEQKKSGYKKRAAFPEENTAPDSLKDPVERLKSS